MQVQNALEEHRKKTFKIVRKKLDKTKNIVYNIKAVAGVAELADAHV